MSQATVQVLAPGVGGWWRVRGVYIVYTDYQRQHGSDAHPQPWHLSARRTDTQHFPFVAWHQKGFRQDTHTARSWPKGDKFMHTTRTTCGHTVSSTCTPHAPRIDTRSQARALAKPQAPTAFHHGRPLATGTPCKPLARSTPEAHLHGWRCKQTHPHDLMSVIK